MTRVLRVRTTVTPHVLRLGDHVYQRLNPWHTGTVTSVENGVSFTVTYDRLPKSREPQDIYTYKQGQSADFLIGQPPAVGEEGYIPGPQPVAEA
jgi:hypothetical protein